MDVPPVLIRPDRSCLVIVDIQPKLLVAIDAADRVTDNAQVLMQAAAAMDVPILVSEQYPRGLGATVPPVADLAPPGSVVEKMHFSCLADGGFAERFRSLDRSQAVIAGIEAHVCVLQTALGLLDAGYAPFVVADAVSSRTAENAQAALRRLDRAGAGIVTTEMVVFEWLERAGTPRFKDVSRLIK